MKALGEISLRVAAIASFWLITSGCLFAAARSARDLQFLDPRTASAWINHQPAAVESLNPVTQSWEGLIQLPRGSSVPSTIRLEFPKVSAPFWHRLYLSIWLPAGEAAGSPQYQVVCISAGNSQAVPPSSSGKILRLAIVREGDRPAPVELIIRSHEDTSMFPLFIAVGYALLSP